MKPPTGTEHTGAHRFDSRERRPLVREVSSSSVIAEVAGVKNSDNFLVDEGNNLFGVFDGVGRNRQGDVAADIAVEMIHALSGEFADEQFATLDQVESYLEHLLEQANAAVLHGVPGAATTAVLAKISRIDQDTYVSVAHVGDSRAYLLQAGVLKPLTLDHNQYRLDTKNIAEAKHMQQRLGVVEKLDDLSEDEHAVFVNRHLIYAQLGETNIVDADVTHHIVQPSDTLVLVTDGVHDNLTTQQMHAILTGGGAVNPADILVKTAMIQARPAHHLRAKRDDMTAIVVNI